MNRTQVSCFRESNGNREDIDDCITGAIVYCVWSKANIISVRDIGDFDTYQTV